MFSEYQYNEAMPDTMQLKEGTKLQGGKYEILRTLGQGGFGITYEASQVLLQRKVAVKEFFMKNCCERERTANQVTVGTGSQKELVKKFRSKFIREAQMIASMNHPHIVGIHDIFEENGTAYFVMDYIEGCSLSEIVNKEGPLSEERALRYIRQVSAALQYVHKNNRLHLDIKPGNIMIDGNDNAILIDFGASKQYDEESGENTSTLLGKTPGYAPPEQMSNSVVKFLPATDIYALGATLYKVLTGVTPPDAFMRISGEELEPLPSHVSGATRGAVLAAMSINKNQRPQTVGAFLQLLESNVSCGTVGEKGEDTDYAPEPPDGNEMTELLEIKTKHPQIEMVYFAGGTFMRGATSEQGSDAQDDEYPVHEVQLSGYYIGKYEVTQALWESVMGTNPSRFKGPDLPVENVSWNDVQEFIRKLNTLTGKSYRLPTEAEWEYAARGGNKSQGYKYSGSNDVGSVAWYYNNSGGTTHPVGTKAANELGIHDMSGNVWEWCQDWNGEYSIEPQTNPKGPYYGSNRVLRGGSWYDIAWRCRVSYRNSSSSDSGTDFIGFRLALSY